MPDWDRRIDFGRFSGLEERHSRLKAFRLVGELFCGCRRLFGSGGVLLNHFVELENCRVYLVCAARLLPRRGRNLLHELRGVPYVRNEPLEHFPGDIGCIKGGS